MTTHDRVDDVVALPDREYDVYTFDLDGTIYLGDGLLPGARETVEALRDRGKVVRFLSNNPTKDPEQYAEKLDGLGLPTPLEEIVNTTVTTTHWLLEHAPGAVVFPIGEEPLKRAFATAGIAMSEDPAEIDIVVASYDRTFEYRKLQIAFDAIWFHRRARLIATNPDRFCPLSGSTTARGSSRRTRTASAPSPGAAASPTAPRSSPRSRRARVRRARRTSASPTRRCCTPRSRASTSTSPTA